MQVNQISRWTYQDSINELDIVMRKQIYNKLLDVLDDANSAIENEILESSDSEEKLSKILSDLLEKKSSPTIEKLRATLGGVRYEVAKELLKQSSSWDVFWSDAIASSIPSEIKFSMEVLEESVSRMYEKDLANFSKGWESLTKKNGRSLENPLKLKDFFRLIYHSQSSQNLSVSLSNLMFLQIEQEMLQSLGILLFDVNSRLSDLGFSPKIFQSSSSSNPPSQAQTNDEALFNTLCDLLQTWDPSELDDIIESGSSKKEPRNLSSEEIFATISSLQQWVPKMLEDALGEPDGRLAQKIKASIIKQAEALGVPKGQAKISDDDNEAVNLVDEVFTHNLYERKIKDAARSVMAQILFPSVKAAILNRRWFSDGEHPARKFIDSMTDAVVPQNGEADEDVIQKASKTVDMLITGFNEDVSVFEALTQELQEYVAEKSHSVDISKVSIPDDVRIKNIKQELTQLWKQWKGPRPVYDFAMELGVEHLLILDKNGDRNTARWSSALGSLWQFLNLRSTIQSKVKIDGILRENLMKMLTSCGWTGVRAHHRLAEQEDIIHAYYVLGQTTFAPYKPASMQDMLNLEMKDMDAVFEKTVELSPKYNLSELVNNNKEKSEDENQTKENEFDDSVLIDKPSDDEFKKEKKEIIISNEQVDNDKKNEKLTIKASDPKISSIAMSHPSSPTSPLSASHENILNKIMDLEIGSSSTWVNSQGDMVIVKLSWISPISMKFLFVNNMGARVLVGTPKELAEMSTKGRFFPGATP